MNKDTTFTLPLILAAARQQTSIGGTDWGMLQAGITDLDHPLHGLLPAAAEVLRRRLHQRRGEVAWTTPIHHPPTPDKPRRQRGAPTIRDVARLAGVSIGTASKALNGAGRLRQETRDKVLRAAREIGYRPERPGAQPAPRPVAHHRHHLQRQLRPLHHPDRRGAGGAAGRRGHRRLHVQRDRRPGARAPAPRPAAAQAHRRAGGDRPPRRQARRRSARSPTACRSSTSSPRPTIPARSACCRTTRAARCSRSSTWPRSAAAASPTSPARSTSRRCACAGRAIARRSPPPGSAASCPASTCPASGRRPGAARPSAGSSTAAEAAGRALLRQRPDRPRRGRRAARARPRGAGRRRHRRLRQLGRDGARGPAAADQRRHEPPRARPRGRRAAARHDRRQARAAACGAGPARWWSGSRLLPKRKENQDERSSNRYDSSTCISRAISGASGWRPC